MKITYLNPENAPKPPAGWRWKTALCKPETIKDWSAYIDGHDYSERAGMYSGSDSCITYITQAPLPKEYFFDTDGTGLDFDDPFYRAGVEQAAKDGKTIQFKAKLPFNDLWIISAENRQFFWGPQDYRIHPRHAADYGLAHATEHETVHDMVDNLCRVVEEAIADIDSVEYWSDPERQRELRMQWASDPTIGKEVWDDLYSKWRNVTDYHWNPKAIYRPRPKPKSQEQIDEEALTSWLTSTPLENQHLHTAFLAGAKYAREGAK